MNRNSVRLQVQGIDIEWLPREEYLHAPALYQTLLFSIFLVYDKMPVPVSELFLLIIQQQNTANILRFGQNVVHKLIVRDGASC